MHIGQEQVIAGTIVFTVVLAVLIATAVEVYKKVMRDLHQSAPATGSPQSMQPNTIKRLLKRCVHAFSAYKNSSKLLSNKVPDDAIKSLYGLKVLSLVWIVVAHAYLTLDLKVSQLMITLAASTTNAIHVKAVGQLMRTRDVNRNFWFQFVINASLAIETFFFISGLLVTLAALRRLKANPLMSPKQWLLFYVHRYVGGERF